MTQKNDGIVYSTRDNYKITSKRILDALREMFETTLYGQLAPALDKFIESGDFLPFKAFADWDSNYNEFKLNILGYSLPPVNNIPDDAMFDDISQFREILDENNARLLQLIDNEMNKQNMLGIPKVIEMRGLLCFADTAFCIEIVWHCFPRGASSAEFFNRQKMKRSAGNN